jgi:hypothetical protein
VTVERLAEFAFIPHDQVMLFLSSAERGVARFGMHVACYVVRERDFRVIGRGTLDVSLTGMLVQCTYDADLGDEVIVSFKTRDGEYVDALGIVTRRMEGRRRGDLGITAAITFTSIEDESLRALARTLELAPVIEKRVPRIDYAREVMRIAAG